MPTVETALGPLDTAKLGFTLSHEHIISGDLAVRHNWPHVIDVEKEIVDAQARLDEVHDLGVRTMVDLTTVDLGRGRLDHPPCRRGARRCRSSSPPACTGAFLATSSGARRSRSSSCS